MKTQGLLLLWFLASIPVFSQDTLQIGKASYYADKLEGHRTASGEIFSQDKMTAAHATLPFHTLVKVTNLQNNKSVTLRINDRMSYRPERVIQLSKAAAKKLNMLQKGMVYVRLYPVDHTPIPKYKPDTSHLKTPVPNSALLSVDIKPVYRNGYGIQIGLYENIKNLRRRMKALRFGWGDNVLVYTEQKQDRTIFKLILGPFDSRYKAEAFKSNLTVLLHDEKARGFIVALDEL